MKYTNKFVEFLNGCNTIIISSPQDYISFKSLLKKVGLDFYEDYYDLLEIAEFNHCAIAHHVILVEYQLGKGLTFGYETMAESEKWYEQKPWTMKEVLASIKGD